MVTTVVEAGPVTVRGPRPVSAVHARTAVAGIDDDTVLIDDEPVAVTQLWVEILDAVGGGALHVTLVCPTWWTVDQCRRVAAVAETSGAEVVVIQRFQALRRSLTDACCPVVEIADELVVVSGVEADVVPLTVARHIDGGGDVAPEAIVRAVMAVGSGAGQVIVDAPPEVAAADVLGPAVAAALRAAGMVVTSADTRTWHRALTAAITPVSEPVGGRRPRIGPAIMAAVAVAVVLGGLTLAAQDRHGPAMTLLVEGGVGIQVPTGWTVQRIVDGPGSARLQVISPADPEVMIHLTQSAVGDGAVADTLREALQGQPAGVFVDFDPTVVIAGRPVVGYREVRSGREIRWAVFVDGPVRIAVGCQSPPGDGAAVRSACEAATRSAHAVR
ncbi:type VII secretion-associated protein [Mycobacterium sp. GA-1841]|uniref:type VII secretion-associated protein n=1 Tax=Mycobacterium sp. GA-1841 TaxID=1834154 RepID=UPI00096CAC6C|nr:type VII secretion-associated protein [Mycobacterium sp. GA-1841]OMC38795.1 type VII secretion-associated protein [Mycobacterium sp. GA-1841]